MKWGWMYVFFVAFLIFNVVGQNYRAPPGVPPRHQQQPEENDHQRSPQYDRSPPGVPPRQMHQNVPSPPQGGDIKFHDPSEYQKTYDAQKKVATDSIKQSLNNQQHPEQSNINNNHAPGYIEAHKAKHSHGMGEAIDAEHMKQHNKKEYVDVSKMSDAELAIHHFRQYDLDDNGRVDGLEVYKKIQMDAAEHGDSTQSEDDWSIVVKVVDNALEEYDENKDGYIYYAEFYRAYKKL